MTQRNKRVLTEQEANNLIISAESDRDLMLIKTTLYHGLRNSEAVKLQRKHIDLEKNQIKIMDGKGNKDRIVPTPSKLQNDLEFYTKDMSYNDYLFPSKRRNKHLTPRAFEMKIRKYALKSNLYPQGITADNLTQEIPYAERIVPHSLRHTYATRLLRAGEPMAKVSRLLGHESVKTTVDIYGHLNIEDLRQTAEKISV